MLGNDAHATTIPNLKRFKSRRGQSHLHADIRVLGSESNASAARYPACLRWQIVDSNLCRHTPTDLESVWGVCVQFQLTAIGADRELGLARIPAVPHRIWARSSQLPETIGRLTKVCGRPTLDLGCWDGAGMRFAPAANFPARSAADGSPAKGLDAGWWHRRRLA